jgi:hypothetical protein
MADMMMLYGKLLKEENVYRVECDFSGKLLLVLICGSAANMKLNFGFLDKFHGIFLSPNFPASVTGKKMNL